MKNCHIYLFLALATCASAVCAQNDVFARRTTGANAAQQQQQQENARVEFYRQQTELLTERVNAMSQDTAQLEQRVSKIEPQLRAITTLQNENAKLRDEVKALRDELAQVKADRETLRKQITDDIVARITTVIEKQNAQKPPPRNNPTGKETGRVHVVEAGQTLSEIARAYKSTVAIIVQANNMKSADSLRVGQELFIPDP